MTTRVLTITQLTNFLNDMDGESSYNADTENLYDKISQLVCDPYHIRKHQFSYDHNYAIADEIMSKYGETVNVDFVKKLTHKEIVDLLGFDFVEVN